MPQQALREYSPQEVIVQWIGTSNGAAFKYTFEGFGDGTFVTTTRNSSNSEMNVGAQGDSLRVHSADKTGTCEMTLMQTSESNIILTAAQNLGDRQGLHVEGDIIISDRSGGALVRCLGAQIMDPATPEFSDGNSNRTWTFNCNKVEYLDTPEGLTQTAQQAARVDSILAKMIQTSSEQFQF